MSGKKTSHEKEKGTYFCSVTHKLDLAEEMIKTLPDFTYWAYIYHEPDTEDGTPHYHFLVRYNGTRSVLQIADKLGIESNYVQVCRKVTAFRRYMLHLDSDEKKKYTIDDVNTNDITSFKIAIQGNDPDTFDVSKLYRDYSLVHSGRLTIQEFIEVHFIEFQKMNFYQKIKTFEVLDKISTPTPHTTT